jgi:putative ABC transport system permease protein
MIILKNFLTTLKRFKASSLLNIFGLAIAFASFYIIMVQVNWDLTYNRGIKDYDKVCMVQIKSFMDASAYSAFLDRPITEQCANDNPSIKSYCLFNEAWQNTILVKKGLNIQSYKVGVARCTPNIIDVFGFKLVSGDLKQIADPKTVIISSNVSKLIGAGVGDAISMAEVYNDSTQRKIVAVYEDFPENSVLGDAGVVVDIGKENINDYSNWNYNVYVKLNSGADPTQCEKQWGEKVRSLMQKFSNSENKMSSEELENEVESYKVRVVKIEDTYFQRDVEGLSATGNIKTTLSLMAIAILIVLIALINFINFFFALVPVRIRAVNTFKIFGSSLFQLRLNFVFEAFGLMFLALLVSVLLVYIFSGTSIATFVSHSLNPAQNIFVFLLTIIFSIVVAVVASVYPAYYITSFSPALVIKGSFGTSRSGRSLRTILISLQFTISIIFIITTIFIKMQHNYMMKYDMGFNKENLLITRITDKIAAMGIRDSYSAKLLQNTQIKEVSYAEGPIVAEQRMGWGRSFKGNNISFQTYPVSWDFLRFMGIKITEGRDFIKSDELDSTSCLIFNEQAKKEFGINLGDRITGFVNNTPVVGFCEDFKFKPLNYGVAPFAFIVDGKASWQQPKYTYIRTTAQADIEKVKEYVEETALQFDGSITKDYLSLSFFDEELGKNYDKEQRLSKLLTLSALLSIFISLIGVFGLVLFDCQYRKREIAIRKVHGATVGAILMLFNTKYIKIVFVCFVVAIPTSWYIMESWLNSFAYRIPLFWWVFAAALIIVLIITILTVTIRSYKVAVENPAESVKE